MNKQLIKIRKGVSTGMVVLAILFAFLISGIRIFGIQVYGVLTGSMEPTYPTGSLIYVKSVNAQELRVNDVITFSLTPGVIATHRIVEVVPDENNPSILRFRTKGDANHDVDASLVSAGNIVGKVAFSVPGLGYLASYIQQPPGIYVAILIGGLMIAFVFYVDSLENKQKQNQPTQQRPQAAAKSVDVTKLINRVSVKLLGKPLIKPKNVAPVVHHPLVRGMYLSNLRSHRCSNTVIRSSPCSSHTTGCRISTRSRAMDSRDMFSLRRMRSSLQRRAIISSLRLRRNSITIPISSRCSRLCRRGRMLSRDLDSRRISHHVRGKRPILHSRSKGIHTPRRGISSHMRRRPSRQMGMYSQTGTCSREEAAEQIGCK